jgi:hypothetical protein
VKVKAEHIQLSRLAYQAKLAKEERAVTELRQGSFDLVQSSN